MEAKSKKAEEGTVSSASSRHFFNKLVAEEKVGESRIRVFQNACSCSLGNPARDKEDDIMNQFLHIKTTLSCLI